MIKHCLILFLAAVILLAASGISVPQLHERPKSAKTLTSEKESFRVGGQTGELQPPPGYLAQRQSQQTHQEDRPPKGGDFIPEKTHDRQSHPEAKPQGAGEKSLRPGQKAAGGSSGYGIPGCR